MTHVIRTCSYTMPYREPVHNILLYTFALYLNRSPGRISKYNNKVTFADFASDLHPSHYIVHFCYLSERDSTINNSRTNVYCTSPAPYRAQHRRNEAFLDLDESAGSRSYFRPLQSGEDNKRISLGASALGSGGLPFDTV